jgi:8-oxo-dGTP pyrophosphatase MutT (NUDIX family)
MRSSRNPQSLPLQVAAVCYRMDSESPKFLLVNSNGGSKWTFPKGNPDPGRSHRDTAEREALEEAGAKGRAEAHHFHLYIHSKGVFWEPSGVREYVVKAFLLEVEQENRPLESRRNPTWFSPNDAKKMLAKGREVKYKREMETLVDRALERILSNADEGLRRGIGHPPATR